MIIANVLAEAKGLIDSDDPAPSADHARAVMRRLVEVVTTLRATPTDFVELPKDHVFSWRQAGMRRRWALEFIPKFAGAARGLGYGVFHGGTLVRDIDLVAVPWRVPAPPRPVEFVLELCHCLQLAMGNHGQTLHGHQWFALWDQAHRDHQIDLKVILPAAVIIEGGS